MTEKTSNFFNPAYNLLDYGKAPVTAKTDEDKIIARILRALDDVPTKNGPSLGNRLVRAQNEYVILHDNQNLDSSIDPLLFIASLEFALTARACMKQVPDIEAEIANFIPKWLAGPIPEIDAAVPVPVRFSNLPEQSMIALYRAAIDRRIRRRNKPLIDTNPHLLDDQECVYMAEVLTKKAELDGFQRESIKDTTHYLLTYFFAIAPDPESNFARLKRTKISKAPQKEINASDILALLEDFTIQTYLALTDLNDPRHLSAYRLLDTIINIDKMIAETVEEEKRDHPTGEVAQAFQASDLKHFDYHDYTKTGMAVSLAILDIVQRNLNLIDYISLLMENTELSGNLWYRNLADDIVRILRDPNFVIHYNRILSDTEFEEIFNLSYWATANGEEVSLSETLQRWQDTQWLPYSFRLQPESLTDLNLHIAPPYHCNVVEINYRVDLNVIEVSLEAKRPRRLGGSSPQAQNTDVLYKTSLVIDLSDRDHPQVFPDIVNDDEASDAFMAGIVTMVNHILNAEVDLQQSKKAAAALVKNTTYPTNKTEPLSPRERKGPSQTPPGARKRKHKPEKPHLEKKQRGFRPVANPALLGRALAGQVDNEGCHRIQLILPSGFELPDDVTIQDILAKLKAYNTGAVRAKTLHHKGSGGISILSLRFGSKRILADIVGGVAIVTAVKDRKEAYRFH